MHRLVLSWMILSLALQLGTSMASRAAQGDPPPNIVLIISDDHAWMDYGFMGSKVVRTPCLDKLAAQSMVFPRGYVPSSLCCPSLASVITPPERFLEYYKPLTPSLHQAKYLGMVEWFDETCGQLMDYLDREDLARNTIVLYFADNGYIVNQEKGGPVRSKLTPYDGGLRTPILLRWPGVAKPGTRSELALSIDFMPTLLAALGGKPTPQMQGLNLLDSAALQARTHIAGACFSHDFTDLNDPSKNVLHRWVIDDRWKLIQPMPKLKNARAELYDVLEDPQEKTDRSAEKPEVVNDLRARLDAWWNP